MWLIFFSLYSKWIIFFSYLCVIKVEGIIIDEEALDGVEVDQHLLVMASQEVGGGHTLTTRDRVTF